MELRQLRYFHEIYLSGSITQAAENLSITQPALSQQMALLERELKVELLERSKNGVRLTRAGEIFAFYAQEIMRKVGELSDALRPPEILPQLRIATGETLASHFVPRLLTHLRARFPTLRLRVIESNLTQMRQALKDDIVDFALSPEAISDTSYINRYLIEDLIVPVVAKNSSLAQITTWQALKDCEWILFHPGSAIRKMSDHVFHNMEKKYIPKIAMEFRSVPGLVRCIEEGLGVGFISRLSLTEKLIALPIPELTRKRRFYLTYKKKHQDLLPITEAVLGFTMSLL
ncbi:MAG: HTH-type transcriptional regulator GltC [Turneriella sp.]|nr:HTH-type transcriptional regulator GltC [Turneriella sp.]